MLCNGSTLARNPSDVGLSSALGTIFSIFITPITILFVVVFTRLFGKELHRQVSVDRVVISGILGELMVITLAQNALDLGLIHGGSAIFPPFITP